MSTIRRAVVWRGRLDKSLLMFMWRVSTMRLVVDMQNLQESSRVSGTRLLVDMQNLCVG